MSAKASLRAAAKHLGEDPANVHLLAVCLSDCELVHCLRIENRALASIPSQPQSSLLDSKLPSTARSPPTPPWSSSTHQRIRSLMPRQREPTMALVCTSELDLHQLTDHLLRRHCPARPLSGAFHRCAEEPLRQSPAMDQDDQRHRRRPGEVLKGKHDPIAPSSSIANRMCRAMSALAFTSSRTATSCTASGRRTPCEHTSLATSTTGTATRRL